MKSPVFRVTIGPYFFKVHARCMKQAKAACVQGKPWLWQVKCKRIK